MTLARTLPLTLPPRFRRLLSGMTLLAALGTALATDPRPANLILRAQMSDASSPLTDSATSPLSFTAFGSGQLYSQTSVPAGTYGAVTVSAASSNSLGTAVALTTSSGSGWITGTGANKLNSLTNNFTAMAWVQPTAFPGVQRVLSDNYSTGTSWGFGLSGSNVYFTKYSILNCSSTGSLPSAGQWYHIAVSASSSGGISFYINGQAAGTVTNTGNNNTSTAAFIVGALNSSGSEQLQGSMDDIRVYNAVLTASEIAQAGADGSGGGSPNGQFDLARPSGSMAFGYFVTNFPNGNFLVTDPYRTVNGKTNCGAVYLYHGATLTNICVLTGSQDNDRVGLGGIQMLTNNYFLVYSPNWSSGTATNAGAITWFNSTNGYSGSTGVSNALSSANSLVGSYTNDSIGNFSVNWAYFYALSNGNYVIMSPNWNVNRGAVTLASSSVGVRGVVGSANSMVGYTANDSYYWSLRMLRNGNFVISWSYADDYINARTDAGATTWCSASSATVGTIGTGNSLFGVRAVWPLANGNYVAYSPYCSSPYASGGAATWCSGTSASPVGYPTTGNSLYGQANQQACYQVTELANGNYVVLSYKAYGQPDSSGAATWCSGTGATAKYVSTGNSIYGQYANEGGSLVQPLPNGDYLLVNAGATPQGYDGAGCVTRLPGGSSVSGTMTSYQYLLGKASDHVGNGGVSVMPDGSYVIYSPNFISGNTVGAVTFVHRANSLPYANISTGNSMVGSASLDLYNPYSGVVTVLSNGSWVVNMRSWNNYMGFVLWNPAESSLNGITTTASYINSFCLYGSTAGDNVGLSIRGLPNSSFVVESSPYNNSYGALTWCSGTSRTVGYPNSGNSLLGRYPSDISSCSFYQLANGNYVYCNASANNGYGWVAFGKSNAVMTGYASHSSYTLMGSSTNDHVGGIITLPNGDYMAATGDYDNGANVDAGAIVYCDGLVGKVGVISTNIALIGASAGDRVGSSMNWAQLPGGGGFLVANYYARAGGIANAGSVNYFANGAAFTGLLNTNTGLIGSSPYDQVGSGGIVVLSNGYCIVKSPYWNNGAVTRAGAITLVKPSAGLAGTISQNNSVLGLVKGDPGGAAMTAAFDYVNSQLIVGHGQGNRVTLLGRANLDLTFTQQPVAQNVFLGGTVTFTVAVTGTGPFTYQWRRGTNDIFGATGATLTVTNLQFGDSDLYSCIVSTGVGSLSTQPAMLTVMSPASLGSGLTGYWPCNDGTDVSGYNHPLTPFSYPRPTTGADGQNWTFTDYAYYSKVGSWLSRYDSSYSSESSGCWATITNYPKTTNAMTIAFWLFTWSFNYPSVIACDGNAVTNSNLRIQTWYNSPSNRYELQFQYANGSCSIPTSSSTYWRHIAMTLDGSTARVYLNGVLANNFSYSGPLTNGSSTLYFNGTGTNVTKSGIYYYSGGYDEIMTWSRALSASELQLVYGQGAAGQPALSLGAPAIITQPQNTNSSPGQTVSFSVTAIGLPLSYQWRKDGTNLPAPVAPTTLPSTYAWWKFDNGAGTNVSDASGNNRNGTIVGPVTWVAGYSNTAVSFMHTGYVALNLPSVPTPWTASFWVRRHATQYVSQGLLWDTSRFIKLEQNANTHQVGVTCTSNAMTDATFNYTAPTNQWVNLVFVGTTSNTAGYANGTLIGSTPYPMSLPLGTIGTSFVSDALDADLDEVRIFDSALNSSQLSVLANTYVPPPELPWTVMVDGNSSTLVLTNLKVADTGFYSVVVTNSYGSVTSSNAYLQVGNPPTFAAQPASVLMLSGQTRLLSATVTGDAPLSYQWRLNGADVAGAVTNTLTLASAALSHAGNYTLYVTNRAGMATSSVAVVEVVLPLTNIMILAGQSTNLSLTCAGGAALTYQWSASSGPLTGVTTGSSLSLTNVKVTQSGSYRAVVTSSFGALTNIATVTVMLAPTMASQPVSVFTNLGATVVLKVTTVSDGVPTYQWYCKDQPLSGATNGTLTMVKTELAQMGYYRVRVTNPVGYVDSRRVWVVLGPLENAAVAWGRSSSGQGLFTPGWTNLVALSAGDASTLGLRGDGTVLATGADDFGQATVPTGLARVVAAAAGSGHSVALREDGTVAAWGANDSGQTNVPAALSNVVAVAAGATHSVALVAGGSVTIFGGDGPAISTVPAAATNVIALAAAARYTVALRWDGQAVVWGSDLNGLDTLPAAATNLTAVAAGGAHIVALRADGAVLAWGDDTYGQVTVPAAVSNAVAVAAGQYHSLAILADGTVVAWGAGTGGKLDEWPHYAQSTVPAEVTDGTAIAAGQYFSVAAVPAAPRLLEPLPSRIGYTLGQTVTLEAKAAGGLPLRYQWFKDGTVVAGATNATLALINLGPYAGATYLVTVSNLVGVVTSGNLSLERDTPYEPLQITVQPQSVNTLRAGSVVLSLGAQGTGPIRFQWRKDGSPLAGATNEFYRAATAQLTDSAGYSVVVNNDWETLTSDTAQVNVLDPPTWPESYTNRTLSAGQALTLTADNTGSGPFDYQWYHNGQPIEGVNSNQLVLASLTWQDEGEYAVKITNPVGTITRTFYNLHVVSPPYLLTDVADVASPRGTNAEFFVRAGGEPPLTYLWYQTSAVMPDEFHTNLVVLSVAYAHTNLSWHVVVSNAMGAVTSREARLTIIEPPTIVTQPVSLLAEPNTEVRFSVVCGGTLPLLYQWYLNGAAVPGGTSTTLVIAAVTAGKQGSYEVEVSNPAGRVLSQAATLAANVAPLALGVSTGRTNVAPGSSFELTARVVGAGPLAIQWQLNGVDLVGQTNLTLVITNTAPEAAGWYTFTVSNGFGSATLEAGAGAEVRVVNLPYIESGPDDVLALLGRPATFSVVVRGTNLLSYQWMKEGQAISGATAAHYTIADPRAPDAGQYSVAVANAEGTTWSSPAGLTFARLPKIIRQPANAVAMPGGITSFSVGVESQFAVSYQWRQDGADLPDQTNAALEVTLPLRVVGWDHSYSVIVGSAVGRVSSLSAVLTLQRTPEVMLKHSRLVTQTLRLHPGWNSIFLTVQPVSNKVAEVFGDAPWTSVWMWRDRENSVQFIQEMTEAAWNGPDWLVNFQTNRTESFQNNLFRLFVNQAYLVHLDTTNEVYLEIQGEPALDVKQWRPDSYNLTGLPIEAGREPKAGDYFRPSPAHYDSTTGQIKPIYQLDADGHWQLLTNDDLLSASVAYWFYVRGGSTYIGPVEVSLSYGRGLLFTKDVETLRLTLLNHTDAARRLWFSAHPLYAGGFPLMVREVTDQGAGFVELPAAYAVDVPANGRTEFILGADRLRTASEGFESVMIVSDDNGLGLQLPVLVEHLGAVTESGGQIKPNVTGLWVGQATFDGISEVNSVTALTNRIRFTNDLGQVTNIVMLSYTNIPSAMPTPVPAGLSQRILFHVDTNSVTRLLSEVFQLYRESVLTTDVDGYKVTAQQGQNVLVTQRSRMGDFKGARMRDGAMVGRRISSPSFAFEGAAGTNNYVACAGQFGPGQTLTATFGLSANHPLNPFKHKYHPDHDNLGADFRTYQEEAYGVIRELTLVFDAQSGGVSPAAGYDELKGEYQEKIRGLHRNPIYASGRFVLRRFSPIGELNPAN